MYPDCKKSAVVKIANFWECMFETSIYTMTLWQTKFSVKTPKKNLKWVHIYRYDSLYKFTHLDVTDTCPFDPFGVQWKLVLSKLKAQTYYIGDKEFMFGIWEKINYCLAPFAPGKPPPKLWTSLVARNHWFLLLRTLLGRVEDRWWGLDWLGWEMLNFSTFTTCRLWWCVTISVNI